MGEHEIRNEIRNDRTEVNSEFGKMLSWLIPVGVFAWGALYGAQTVSYIGHGEFSYERGAVSQIIGRPQSELYHSIDATVDGFTAIKGAQIYNLDKDGMPLR